MALDDVRFLEFGPFRFDRRSRLLTRDGVDVPLTPRAADLLLALLSRRGDLATKEDLLKEVWSDAFVEEGNLAYQIHAIQRALRDAGDGLTYIENLPRRGYRISVPVRESAMDPPTAVSVLAAGSRPPTGMPDVEIAPPGIRPLPPIAPGGRRPFASIAAVAVIVIMAGVAGGFVALDRSPGPLRVTRYEQITTDRRAKEPRGPLQHDGEYVYFPASGLGPTLRAPATGGDTAPAPEAIRDLDLLDVHSARGTFLAVNRADDGFLRQLWEVSTSGSRRRVGTVACATAAWSPDGAWIACTSESAVNVVRPDGSQSRPVAVVQGEPRWPRWSPDGRLLRFTVVTVMERVPRRSIWEVTAEGTGLRRLPLGRDAADECCGAWTPDGRHYVFESRAEDRSEIWALQEKGGPLRGAPRAERLTAGPLSYSMPVVSADGSRIFALGRADHGELVRYDNTVREFVPYLSGISAVWVSFSSDGEWVAYVRYPENTLWRARADGSEPKQLTFRPLHVEGSTWSPDGKWIAFRAAPPGRSHKIFLIPSEGGEARPLVEEDREQGIPSWSPEQSRLVFGEIPKAYGYASGEAIHVFDLETRISSPVPGSANLWSPRWSPDGRYIAAATIAGRSLRLYDVAKGVWKALDAHHVDNISWSRDSRHVVYHTEGNVRSLRRVRVSDGVLEELVNLHAYPIKAYWWSGLSLDGSPLVLRDVGAPEIYALELDRR